MNHLLLVGVRISHSLLKAMCQHAPKPKLRAPCEPTHVPLQGRPPKAAGDRLRVETTHL